MPERKFVLPTDEELNSLIDEAEKDSMKIELAEFELQMLDNRCKVTYKDLHRSYDAAAEAESW